MPSPAKNVSTPLHAHPAPGASAGVVPNDADAYTHLSKRFINRVDTFVANLQNPEFYGELLFIVLAMTLAWLVAKAVQQRVKSHVQKHPPRRIDAEFITRPLLLLGPLLAMLFLTIDDLVSTAVGLDTGWVEAMLKLSMAYLCMRGVFLIVRTRPVAWFISLVIMIVAVLRAAKVMRSVDAYLDSIAFDVGHYHITVLKLINGLVVLVVVFWVASLLSRTLESYLRHSSSFSYNARELTVKCFKVTVYFIALMITLSAIGVDITAFAVFGGAVGVGVGLGLQKLTSNFLSSVTLLMERSVKVGDLVEVGGNTGWIRQLNMRYALLETFDGREIMIPNEVMVSSSITNWTHTTTKASVEIKVAVDYDSDAAKARELMLEAAREHPRCLKEPAPSCYLKEFGADGLHFTLTFWISDITQGRNGPQNDVMFAILKKFHDAGIKMPKPAA